MLISNRNFLLRAFSFAIAFVFIALNAMAQSTGTISGTVKDAMGNPLAGASVVIEGTKQGAATDANGFFSLKVESGNYTIVISYVGVQTQKKNVSVISGAILSEQFDMQNSADLNRVVVVGSRSNLIRTSTQTPVPIDVVSAKELVATGQVEPTQMINFVAPSFNSSRQTIADGTDHIDPATLRGLGPDQVLVLVNGRRRYNTALLNVNGTIGRGSVGTDLNSIPVAAIEKIEVLRDGASSQYGSDAIAGVINVVTKKSSAGSTLTTHLGQQYEGDGMVKQFGFNKGVALGNKGGYLNISTDYRHREATNRCGDFTGTVFSSNAVLDQVLIQENGGFDRKNNMHIGNSEVTNKGVLVNIGFPIRSNLKFTVTAGRNYRNGKAAGFYRYPKQTAQVIAELYPKGFLPEIHSIVKDNYVIAALEGKLGGDWNWDLSQTVGGNSFQFDVKNSNNASQYALKEMAQTEFYAGKLGFNQKTSNLNLSKDFGKQIGVKSFNVAIGGEYRIDNYNIEAGELASYYNYAPTSGRVGGAQVFPGFQPANEVDESRSVVAGYLDIETDITDKFLVNAAGRYESNNDYGSSIAGKLAAHWQIVKQLALRSSFSNGFRAPSMQQSFFSAISTVFIPAGPGGSLIPVQQGTFRNNSAVATAFGVPALTPETSTNFSIGLTAKPIKNLSITVDGYVINIKDRIVLSGSFLRYNSNGTPNSVIDAILDADPNLNDVASAVFFSNAIDTRTEGIDVVVAYSLQMGKGTLAATLAGNYNKSTLESTPKVAANLPNNQSVQNTLFDRSELGRFEEGQPRDKVSLNLNYRTGNWVVNLRSTRFGKVATRHASNSLLDEVFTPKIITDASISCKVSKCATLTLGGNNIGDTYPDRMKNFGNTSDGRFVYSRNATQFGFNGGYGYLSITFDLQSKKSGK